MLPIREALALSGSHGLKGLARKVSDLLIQVSVRAPCRAYAVRLCSAGEPGCSSLFGSTVQDSEPQGAKAA